MAFKKGFVAAFALISALFLSTTASAEDHRDVIQGLMNLSQSTGIAPGVQEVPTGPWTTEQVPRITSTWNFGQNGFQPGVLPETRFSDNYGRFRRLEEFKREMTRQKR